MRFWPVPTSREVAKCMISGVIRTAWCVGITALVVGHVPGLSACIVLVGMVLTLLNAREYYVETYLIYESRYCDPCRRYFVSSYSSPNVRWLWVQLAAAMVPGLGRQFLTA